MRMSAKRTTLTAAKERTMTAFSSWAFRLKQLLADVGSGTVQLVCVEFATRRRQFKKTRLNWRVSNPKSPK